MFDNIKCEYPLPDTPKNIQEGVFQTKDLINILDDYTITEDGRLIHHQCDWKIVEEEDRPYYGKPEWDKNPLYQIFGSMERVPLKDVETPHHGMMRMISAEPGPMFYEYELKFTDGKVVEVKTLFKEYGNE
jgi:hypothetical protein